MKTMCIVVVVLCCSLFAISSLYADLDDGLVLHYTFDADEGAVVTDQSPSGNDGINNGATWMDTGVLGGAMSFDGAEYIRVPRDPSLEPTQITVACWVRFDRTDVGGQGLVFKKNPRTTYHEDYHLMLEVDYTTRLIMANPAGTQHSSFSRPFIVTGVWYHVVGTFSQPFLRMYVNGEFESQVSHDFPFYHDATRDVLLGAVDHALVPLFGFLRGDLDDVRIWNRALSPAEVAALYGQTPATDDWSIAFVGFSNDPEGDQDVTEFVADETLYIRVKDVDISPDDEGAYVKVVFSGGGGTQHLEGEDDGSWTGAFPLANMRFGKVKVHVRGRSGDRDSKLQRKGYIYISPVGSPAQTDDDEGSRDRRIWNKRRQH